MSSSKAIKRHNTIDTLIKDPGSAITHFIAMVFAIVGAFPLILRAINYGTTRHIFSMIIFIVTMILLYAASTCYHTFDISPKINKTLKKVDHCMISVMIAGSYTPICLIVLNNTIGLIMLITVWSAALLGIIFKLCWVTCPRFVSSILYITMGWTCVMGFGQIYTALPLKAFVLLLVGGIIYTLGGVIYALKLPIFNSLHKNFGSHEIFHVFVMVGSLFHYIMMYGFVSAFPILFM